jgi:hypothetical protein
VNNGGPAFSGVGEQADHPNRRRHRGLRNGERASRERISNLDKFRKTGQIFRNVNGDFDLRPHECNSFSMRRYT